MKKIITLVWIAVSAFTAQAQIQQLQKLGQLSFMTSCAGVWHYADSLGNEYALLGNGDGLVIVDVNDPVNPAVLHTVPAANSLWREVKTYGHYAYAGTEGGGGITIVDLSGLPGSYVSKIYDGDGIIAGQLDNSHTVQVFDDHLYIFGSNLGSIICSLADPWNPQYVGTYAANYVHDGYVLNDTLYSSEIYAGQFSVVDVTDKANPVVVASQPTPGAFNHNGWFSDNRRYFYTTDELNNTPVGVFDMADIQDIKLVETYVNDTMPDKEIHNVRVFNDYLLCPSYGSQLTIVDGARPENLIEIARYQTGGYLCWDASPYLPSGNIIATDMDGEFYVFAPYYVRACYLEGNVTDLVTGLPILGANVRILSTSVLDSSKANGDYKTGYPTAGTFDVEFSKPGYITKTETGVVLANGVLTVLDVQLEPLMINLNVIDNITSLPVPFAKVKIQNGSTDVELTTDVNGTVSLSAVSSGNYDITAAAWGYRSTCMPVSIGTPGTITMLLDAGLYDDFTFDFGWTVTGNASSGLWVLDEPIGTMFSATQANPDFDVTNDCSDRCYITGNGGGSANFDDVDDGFTTLTSPVFDATTYTDPYLSYQRWFYEQFTTNASANDTLFISLTNGSLTTPVEVVTGPAPNNSSWVTTEVRMLDYLPLSSTMQLIVTISDKLGSGNPLECGLDKFGVSEGPSGLVPALAAAGITAYPNPVNDQLEITIHDPNNYTTANVEVTDTEGRLIARFSKVHAGSFTLNTAGWSRGVYVVRVSSETTSLKPLRVVKL